MLRTTSILVLAALAAACISGCKVKDPPPVTEPWSDDFERDEIGGNYFRTGGSYSIEDGALTIAGAHNHPLWLRKKLPRDIVIELDAWSNSPKGDIKVEVFGDGTSHARNKGAYKSSGYVLCMGGWSNSKSILARQDEHGKELASRTQPKVQAGKRYHWKIVRQGDTVDWYVDYIESGKLIFE